MDFNIAFKHINTLHFKYAYQTVQTYKIYSKQSYLYIHSYISTTIL